MSHQDKVSCTTRRAFCTDLMLTSAGLVVGLTSTGLDSLERAVANKMWTPRYLPLKHITR